MRQPHELMGRVGEWAACGAQSSRSPKPPGEARGRWQRAGEMPVCSFELRCWSGGGEKGSKVCNGGDELLQQNRGAENSGGAVQGGKGKCELHEQRWKAL